MYLQAAVLKLLPIAVFMAGQTESVAMAVTAMAFSMQTMMALGKKGLPSRRRGYFCTIQGWNLSYA
jgi:hypothetical protein